MAHDRFAEDVDILMDSDPDYIARLLKALADYGEGFSHELTCQPQ